MQTNRSYFLFKIYAVFLCCKFSTGPTNFLLLWLQPCLTYCSNTGRMHQGAAKRNVKVSDFTPRVKILLWKCYELLKAERFYKIGQFVFSDLYCPSSPICTGEMVRTTVSLSASKEPLKIDDWKGMNKIDCIIAVFIGPRSDHSLPMSVNHWLTNWRPCSRLNELT